MRDMLLRYEGMSSNLGKLVKVGPDFLLFEEESGRMVVSLAAVLSVREVLPGEEEENPEKTLEIRLVAAD
jgi:hypothetical protein